MARKKGNKLLSFCRPRVSFHQVSLQDPVDLNSDATRASREKGKLAYMIHLDFANFKLISFDFSMFLSNGRIILKEGEIKTWTFLLSLFCLKSCRILFLKIFNGFLNLINVMVGFEAQLSKMVISVKVLNRKFKFFTWLSKRKCVFPPIKFK